MKFNKKTLIIILSVLVVLILAATIYFIVSKKNISQTSKTANNSISQEELIKNQEKKAYDDYQKQLAVVYAKNIDGCSKLVETDEINECLDAIAVQANRKDYCEKIKDDDKLKNECLNSIDYMNISWGSDPNGCSTLSNKTLEENCYQEYFVKLNSTQDCEIVKEAARKTQCLNLVNKRLAIVFNKPEACNAITDNKMKLDCKANKVVAPLDSDHDGLPDDVEISLGLNPFKADTDGDGVNDYNEINVTHTNPLKAN